MNIATSRMCPSTVRLVIFTTELHGFVTFREYVETVAPLPTVDVKSVTAIRKTVARRRTACHIKIKERTCEDTSSRALEANKHACTRTINKRTPCEKALRENRERTTGAEDTQNQHYQRVRTVVDT